MQSKAMDIKSFLFDNVYNHQNLLDKRQNVEKIISIIYLNIFIIHLTNFPNDWRKYK